MEIRKKGIKTFECTTEIERDVSAYRAVKKERGEQ